MDGKKGLQNLRSWLSILIFMAISFGSWFFPSSTLIAAAESPSRVVFAVNCGGGQYTDRAGVTYQADTRYMGGKTYKTASPIEGTEDDPLYQSERYGNFSYSIPLSNGTYNVTLKFAEIYAWQKGQRLFSVKIEGREVITKLDLFDKAGGKNRAYDLTFPVTVSDGVLNLEWITVVNAAKVNAIVVSSGEAAPSYTITATAGPGGTINPMGAVRVASGADQTFSMTAQSGYTIDQVLVDGRSMGAIPSYTFRNVTAPHTISVSFKPQSVGPIGCTSGGIPAEYYDELCTPKVLPVLVINYIPVGNTVENTIVLRGGENETYSGNAVIHCEETGIPDGCVQSGRRMLARERLPALRNGARLTVDFLTEATRFHGYKNPQAPPALTFQIVDTVTILQKQDYPNDPLWPNGLGYRRGNPVPYTQNEYRDPFRYIFETANICQYVKNQGVRLVLYNTYFFHGSVPAESFSAGPFGNIGNSEGAMTTNVAYCRDGVSVASPQEADVTYHAIGYHPTEGTFVPGNAIEDFTHHLESLFGFADGDLWRKRFVGPEGHLDRAYMGWWVPGLLPDQYFDHHKVVNTWGLKIWVDAINDDRSTRLHIEPVPGVNPPERSWPPGDRTPNVRMNEPFTIASDATVALEGKDIKINYWENAGRAFFNVYRPSADFSTVRRCGWTHFPPNGEGDYDWGNARWRVRSDCEDWLPDQRGEIQTDVDCRLWTGIVSGDRCPHDPNPSTGTIGAELGFKKWWMQNIPGLDNRIIWNEGGQTRHARNFWYYLTDYHRSVQKNRRLSFPIQRIEVEGPSNLRLTRSGNGISLSWTAPSGGAEGYNIFRSDSPNGPFNRINNRVVTQESFFDDFVLNSGKTYYYDIRSVKGLQSETGAQGFIPFQ